MHIAAPAIIWTYVYAYASVAGGGAGANVVVARVSCILGAPRREMQVLTIWAGFELYACSAQRELEHTRKSECLRMRRSRCRAVGVIRGGSAPSTPGPPEGMNIVSHV